MNVTPKRRRRKPMKPNRTLGKSALWRNRQDPVFGRGEATREHRLNRKHRQSLFLRLKLPGQLRITDPPKRKSLELHGRIAKAKRLQPRRKINLKRNWRGRCGGV